MEPSTGSTQLTLDEIGSALEADAQKPADLAAIKVDGDAVPEHLRGKSADDLLKHVQALESSLKKSEEARLQPQVTERVIERPVIQPPAAPQAPQAPTKEQLAQMFQENPVDALELYGQYMAQNLYRNFEARLGGITQSSMQAAERQARERYKEEFELFGDQIERVKAALPDPSSLSQPQSWDDLMAYVRGQPHNFERLVEHRAKKAAPTRAEAQQEQVVAAPAHITPAARTPAPTGGAVELDELEREIARNLNMTEAEYAKWKKIR